MRAVALVLCVAGACGANELEPRVDPARLWQIEAAAEVARQEPPPAPACARFTHGGEWAICVSPAMWERIEERRR